jgi:MFS family permease
MEEHTTASTVVRPPPAEADPEVRNVRRAAWAGLVGTMLEQYDFVIYGTASALIFSRLFFPNISPAAGIMASFGAYAVGFVARPLGGLFFSRYGDRLGRKWVLVATLFFMGGSTLAIGLLPTYDQVGILAPILLVVCRFFQGFGAGAEQSGGATLLTETAPIGRRGRYASLIMVGAALGTALGAVVWILVQLLPEDELLSWGWRLIFLSSIVVTVFAMVIRRTLKESPVFRAVKARAQEARAPVRDVFKHGRRPLLLVFFMNAGVNAQSYTYQVFMAAYLTTIVRVDPRFVPKVLLVGALCGCLSAFLTGAGSDVYGRRRVYSVIAGALVLLPVPSFIALGSGSNAAVVIVIILGFMLGAYGAVGVQMSYFPELFGSRYRYAGVTLGREFSSVVGGGVAPLICSALLAWFNKSWVPVAIYMMVMSLVSFVAVRLAPETLNRDLTVADDAQPTHRTA